MMKSLGVKSGRNHRTVRRGEGKLLHDALDFVHRVLRALTLLVVAKSLVVTADDLLAGGGSDGFVVHEGVARHVHALSLIHIYYPERDEWALHLFSKKQMDLNWDCLLYTSS